MARGRMISNTIGESRKFAALSCNEHRLIYLMVLPWVDKAGRFEADPIIITSKCLLRLDIDASTVQAWLKDAANVGLINVYEADGIPVLEIVDFLEHNTPHHKEPESELPDPPEQPPASTKPAGSGTPSSTAPVKHESSLTPSTTQAQAKHEPSSPIIGIGIGSRREEETKPLSTDVDAADPPSPVKKSQKPDRPTDQDFVDTWNEHRGMLPRVLVAKGRKKFFDRLRRELGDEALDLFRDAVKQVAQEPYYLEKGYGIGHLLSGDNGKVLKWAEKWRDSGGMSDSDRKLASTASKVAKAIGGMS